MIKNILKESGSKTALIVGASGLVGEQLLSLLLASPRYNKVIALVRKPLPLEHHKLVQWPIDFENLTQQLPSFHAIDNTKLDNDLDACERMNRSGSSLTKVDHIYCTLGSTIKKAGSKQAFHQVDHDYPLAIAKYFHQQGASLFAIVSAIGANINANVFYNQVKGEVEASLTTIGYRHLGIFRPSMLAGNRKEYRLAEHLGTILMKTFAFLIPKKYQVIEATKVANAMIAFADKPIDGTTIIQSDQLQNH
jgi:uncharacterized protein YbjT (DUF2867 family)